MKNEKIKKFFSGSTAKGAVLVAAVLLIGLAIYLNYRWFYDPIDSIGFGDNNMDDNLSGDNSQQTGGNADQSGKNDYFTATALDRQEARDEAIDVLKLVTENEEASAEAKEDAQSKISKIATDIQNEANIETLVKAKGFEECVAIISDDAVSVIVSAETLQASQAAQILSIVYNTTGISPEKISIINK